MNINEQKKLVDEVLKGKRKNLGMNDKFKFECTGCGKCCYNNDVLLNVYDLIRLRHGLKKPTQDIFKAGYVNFYIGTSSGLPILSINFKKLNDSLTCCPFLAPAIDFKILINKIKKIKNNNEGKIEELIKEYQDNPDKLKKDLTGIEVKQWLCSIHKDRPIICKLYPCGRFQEINKNNKQIKESFILQDDEENKKFCPGFNTQKEVSLQDFLIKQDFWNSKEGSIIFSSILELLNRSGFFIETSDNKKGATVPLFKNGSKVISFLGNLLYNFDSFNTFSKDKRVIDTIYSKDIKQEDFIYVENKVFNVVKSFVNMIKTEHVTEENFFNFIKTLTGGGEKNG